MNLAHKQKIRYHEHQAPNTQILNPYFVTGFADGESTFGVYFRKGAGRKFGYSVSPSFSIGLHSKDRLLIERVQSFFEGVGIISEPYPDVIHYTVSSREDLAIIIRHFDKYPLVTQKLADYVLFKQAFELISRKEHLTEEGFTQLVAIRATINRGLSDTFKASFPGVIPLEKPVVKDQQVPDPWWLAGFVSAEGSLGIEIYKSSTKTGFNVALSVRIYQHYRDEELLKSLRTYLGCGRVTTTTRGDRWFVVAKFTDIETIVITFFDKYSIEGVKALDYADFKKAVEIVKAKTHLTKEGLEIIRKLKAGMNKGRTDWA